ncbi:MAG: hypothetical protein II937_00435 [Bacteroidales bacterium]|nr:hypothetical protein [Bacteroidales bacterium]
MDITFKKSKENKVYQDFVENPDDRKCRRMFQKTYGTIADEALKVHTRLKSFDNAGAYNRMYGSTDNRIELKTGCKQKDPQIFKVRVTVSYRKFFFDCFGMWRFVVIKRLVWRL